MKLWQYTMIVPFNLLRGARERERENRRGKKREREKWEGRKEKDGRDDVCLAVYCYQVYYKHFYLKRIQFQSFSFHCFCQNINYCFQHNIHLQCTTWAMKLLQAPPSRMPNRPLTIITGK